MVQRRILRFAVGCCSLVVGLVGLNHVHAHGSLQTPMSRTYACFLEGPETPATAACRAAIERGGTQALYDWNEVNIGDAAGRHRSIIPDGKLCSAGREKYAGFDLARADWPATPLNSGSSLSFLYKATAPHRGTFDFYLTRTGYDPNQPLKWSDLEATPFASVTNPALVNGSYVINATLPSGKTGRHLIYSIWQRSDSPEAFYSCSDVTFGGSNQTTVPTATPRPTSQPSATPRPTSTNVPTITAVPTNTPVATPRPTNVPTATPNPSTPAWQAYTSYATGAGVTYAGHTYICRQAHTSLPGWEPAAVPALWQLIN
ncbi:lytic polysaccharide monooxygenase [Herpetosiphon giganteus]|uniref:lytic polysaccharide monooxygenase n=1 Tax=Herpetosiphon giganteus TaxID=2029754 RepID=UPI001956F2FD|nr:lytic polysaccharide monooxygenase [Herpetosiphon giganteus]MBM7842700.1 chitin-binding protein [Herpetosiphon giganteus]